MSEDAESFFRKSPTYQIIQGVNKLREKTEIGIAIRRDLTLLHLEFVDVSPGPALPWVTRMFGALIATCTFNARELTLCSLHLPAFLQVRTRQRALHAIAERLKEIARQSPDALVVGGGDFNTIFAKESAIHGNILGSEFSLIPNGNFTCSTIRIEPSNIANKAVWLLSHIGCAREFTLDHLFTNKPSSATNLVVLPDVVSDHRPLALTLTL